MKSLKVYPLKSKSSGNPVLYQYVIVEKLKNKTCLTFQSYNTIICKIILDYTTKGANKIYLDSFALDYSRTTSKYLYNFLDSFSILHAGKRKKEILQAIKNKEIQTKNLN